MWAGVTSIAALLALRPRQPTVIDSQQMVPAMASLLRGRWSGIFPVHTALTSGPGYLLFDAPICELFGGMTWTSQQVSSLVVSLLLAGAAVRLLHALRPDGSRLATLLVGGAALLGAPTLVAEHTFYHPEDILATAMVVLAAAEIRRDHPIRVGVLIGLAVVTRQWAIPLALALVVPPWVPTRRMLVPAVVVVLAVLLPFAVASPEGLLWALRAPTVLVSPYSLWGHVGLRGQWAYRLARGGPLVVSFALAAVWRRRWAVRTPGHAEVVAAVGVLAGVRILLDVATLGYYDAPLFVVLCVLGVAYGRQRRSLVVPLVLEAVLVLEPRFAASGGPPLLMALVLTGIEVWAVLLTWRWSLASLDDGPSAGAELMCGVVPRAAL